MVSASMFESVSVCVCVCVCMGVVCVEEDSRQIQVWSPEVPACLCFSL